MTRKKRLRRDEREARKLEGQRSPSHSALDAAHGYRAQQQAKIGKVPSNESIESKVSRAFRHLQQFFPDLEKHKLISDYRRQFSPVNTNWDDPVDQSIIQDLKAKIESACKTLGYSLRDGVSIGMLHAEGTEAMQQPVMMTDTSVIMMTGNLRMLIHRTAKLLALSVPFTKHDGHQFKISEDIKEAVALVNKNEQLRKDWADLFIDHAVNSGAPYQGKVVLVTGLERQTMWGDLSEAMSLFVVGHEYAHHILKHSLAGSASASGMDSELSHEMERDADMLGLKLSMHAGAAENESNYFAIFGVGAFVVLAVIEYCRHAVQVLNHGEVKKESRATHPPLVERLESLAQEVPKLIAYHPNNTSATRRIHGMFVGIVHNAWRAAEPILLRAHQEGHRPVYRDEGGWLPGRGIVESTSTPTAPGNGKI